MTWPCNHDYTDCANLFLGSEQFNVAPTMYVLRAQVDEVYQRMPPNLLCPWWVNVLHFRDAQMHLSFAFAPLSNAADSFLALVGICSPQSLPPRSSQSWCGPLCLSAAVVLTLCHIKTNISVHQKRETPPSYRVQVPVSISSPPTKPVNCTNNAKSAKSRCPVFAHQTLRTE